MTKRVADVADDRGAAAHRFVDPVSGRPRRSSRRLRIGIAAAAPRRRRGSRPRNRVPGGTSFAQIRKLEMRVRVDEPGQDGDATEVARRRREGPSTARAPMTRPRSTPTHPSRIGGAAIGSTHDA